MVPELITYYGGGINGFFVIIEHVFKGRIFWNKIPKYIKWIYSTIISIAFWQLFRFGTITEAYSWFCIIIGRNKYEDITFTWQYFLNNSTIFFLVIGGLGATMLGTELFNKFTEKLRRIRILDAIKEVVFLLLFIASIIYMVNSAYSPFIYFQY